MIKKLFVLIASVLFTISAFAQTPVIGPVGLSGVVSINSSTGNFTFTGSGVSCTGTTCTFTGGSVSFTALSGDAHSTSTGGATTVTGLNGTQLSALASGILYNTTATGVPSIATAAQIIAGFGTQTANTIFAGPASGSAAAPTFRALVSADIPNNAANTSGTAGNLSGTPALPNGTTATTQSQANGSTKLATTAYVDTGLATKGAGTVTAVSIASANGVSGTSSGGATPALTIALGAITPTSVVPSTAIAHANIAATAVTPGSYTNANITVAADGSVTAAANGSSGGVSSTSNSDGTLTISPTTGAVVASLALGHANTWTATQTFTNLALLAGGTIASADTGTPTLTWAANSIASNVALSAPSFTGALSGNATTATSALSLLKGTYTNGDMCTYTATGTLLNCNTAVPLGTVTAVSIASANGVSGTSSGGATPALTIALGAITPSSVASTGAVSGSSFQGTGTTPNSLYLSAGTGNIGALAAHSAGFAAPVTGGTSFLYKLPATAAVGILHAAAAATGDNVNESALTSSAINLASADVTGILPTGNLPASMSITSITFGNSAVAGTAVRTGTTPSFTAPFAGTIISATLTGTLSAGNCSAVIDVWKVNAAIPTVTNTITASDLPTLSTTKYYQDTTLTGWSTGKTISKNDVLMANVNSATCDNWNLVLAVQQ